MYCCSGGRHKPVETKYEGLLLHPGGRKLSIRIGVKKIVNMKTDQNQIFIKNLSTLSERGISSFIRPSQKEVGGSNHLLPSCYVFEFVVGMYYIDALSKILGKILGMLWDINQTQKKSSTKRLWKGKGETEL